MSTKHTIAVPSDAPGGLAATPSAHFGHCDVYTLATVENGSIVETSLLYNEGHDHGNCLAPVQSLADAGVTALVAGGMGMRPFRAMQDAGITVYYSAGLKTVQEILDRYAQGKLIPFGDDNMCKGGCGNH